MYSVVGFTQQIHTHIKYIAFSKNYDTESENAHARRLSAYFHVNEK